MAFISLGFILIYGNQAALSLVARDKELSAWSEQRPHRVDLFGGLSCWIRDTWYRTNNLPVRTCRMLNVYSQVIFLQREGKLELNHQCFIDSCLWIFQQLGSSWNASQVDLGETCWELCCACRLFDMHSQSLSRASKCTFPLFLVFFCTITEYSLHL